MIPRFRFQNLRSAALQTEYSRTWRTAIVATLVLFSALLALPAPASDFSEPWLRKDRALVLDAYEYNPLDWEELATNKRLAGFISKGSDGLPPPYYCKGNETEIRLCKALWKRYAVARELYHTRRSLAKSIGLKWGVYHLGRPGNPIDQANHLIDYAEPAEDDLIAIDIEDNDPEKWMSLNDAEIFARHIKFRTGRYPVLYTNGNTAKYIADNRLRFPLLSRLPLWYARYKPAIGMHFPKGNWESYALWQFVSNVNCSKRRCPYRMKGTPLNIDVNVAAMSAEKLRKAWPFGGLLDPIPMNKGELVAAQSRQKRIRPKVRIPLPISRKDGLAGDARLSRGILQMTIPVEEMVAAYRLAENRYRSDPAALAKIKEPASDRAKSLGGTDNRVYALAGVAKPSPEAAIEIPVQVVQPEPDLAKIYAPMRTRTKITELQLAGLVRDALHQRLDEYVDGLKKEVWLKESTRRGVDTVKTATARAR